MIRSDPHGTAEFLTTQNKRRKGIVQPFQFLFVLGVAVFANLKFLSVGIVAGVDPDFVYVFNCFHGGLRKKVNIRNQGKIEARFPYFPHDRSEGFGRPDAWRGYTNDLASRFSEFNRLTDGCPSVERIGRGH